LRLFDGGWCRRIAGQLVPEGAKECDGSRLADHGIDILGVTIPGAANVSKDTRQNRLFMGGDPIETTPTRLAERMRRNSDDRNRCGVAYGFGASNDSA
jgi:hypothetical protein